jgi:hypothetical protein
MINAFPDDWFEGIKGDVRGFVPGAYIEVVPFNPLTNRRFQSPPIATQPVQEAVKSPVLPAAV